MPPSPILAPVVALTLWTLVMLAWLVLARGRAMRAKGISLKGRRGGRGSDLEGVLDAKAQWPSHNYNHLMEQPTLFYAVSLALAVAGAGEGLNAILAWIYVASRVAHSLVQATSNIIALRFACFAAGTVALIVLALRAALVVF